MNLALESIVVAIDRATAELPFSYALYWRRRGQPPILRQNCALFLSASIIKAPILFAWAYLEAAGVVSSDEEALIR